MKDKLTNLLNKGFFHIFGSSVINQIVGFSSSIFLVRLLSKEQFGMFSYSQNLLSFFLLFNGLGATAAILQFASEKENKKEKLTILNYCVKFGIVFSLICSSLIIVLINIVPVKIDGAEIIIKMMFLIPIFVFLFQSLQVYLRVLLENKKYSFLTSLNSVLILVFSIIGAYLFEVEGVVIFRYIAYSITIVVGVLILKKDLLVPEKITVLSRNVKNEILKFSIISSVNNGVSQLLYIIDIFLIGIIISDETIIASYKVATLIPFALNFIPASIMTFIYPYFARNNCDKEWIKSNFIKVIKYLAILNGGLSLVLVVFSPFIIKTIFGAEYLDSVIPFRILSLGYFVAGTFRIPVGNVLVMLRDVKFGFYLAIVTGIFNIVLDVILIKNFGSNGAAFATVSVYIFTSIVGVWYLMHKLKVQN